jgi:hypothetical protein
LIFTPADAPHESSNFTQSEPSANCGYGSEIVNVPPVGAAPPVAAADCAGWSDTVDAAPPAEEDAPFDDAVDDVADDEHAVRPPMSATATAADDARCRLEFLWLTLTFRDEVSHG